MQVLCKASNTGSDVRCQVCGQGFLVYWTRPAPEERIHTREEILLALREHHALDQDQTKNAHPPLGFNLPEWEAQPNVSAAALMGSPAAWATV